uniref:Craniofacial development protein 2 n=1 Tax=Cacopsylla melanoneura TaxID=428564 RepID=A0A8D8YRG1_9HEMI
MGGRNQSRFNGQTGRRATICDWGAAVTVLFVGGGQEARTAMKQIAASDCGVHDDGCCTAMRWQGETSHYFSQNQLYNFIMMASSKLKFYSGIGPHSDSREVPGLDDALVTDRTKNYKKQNILKIGTWNVQSLGHRCKLDNIILEMKRYDLEIVGISEVKWKNQGDYWKEHHRFIYSGNETGDAGVGLILNKEWGNRVRNAELYSNRIMLVKLQLNDKEILNIIQIYMPHTGYSDEVIEEIYDQIDEVMDLTNRNEKVIIMGDWNARVGCQKDHVTGYYGYGDRNCRGERLIQFCKDKDLVIANTLFKQPLNRRYTWTNATTGNKSQIDFIIVKKTDQKSVLQSKSYPGADINSDHNLLFMKIRLQSKKKVRKFNNTVKFDLNKLKYTECKIRFQNAVRTSINGINDDEVPNTSNEKWNLLKDAIKNAAINTIGTTTNIPRKPWINQEVIDLIEERRKHKKRRNLEEKIRYKYLKMP